MTFATISKNYLFLNIKISNSMKKFCTILFLLSLQIVSFAQNAKKEFVIGSQCSILIPEGFVNTGAYAGVQNKSKTTNVMISHVKTSAAIFGAAFNKDSMSAKGFELLDNQEVNIQQGKAWLVKSKNTKNQNYKHVLYFEAAPNNVVCVTGQYPEKNKDMETVVVEMLTSVFYDKEHQDNLEDFAPFFVSVPTSFMKAAKGTMGTLVYSNNGLNSSISTENSSFVVTMSGLNRPVADLKSYCEERSVKNYRIKDLKIKESRAVKYDGLEGYECVAEGTQDGKAIMVFYTYLFQDKRIFLMQGNSMKNIKDELKQFREISKTFKRKA